MRLFAVLLFGIGLYFLQLYLYRYFWDKGLNVTIDFARNIVREGEENKLIETISNDKLLPLPVVQVKFSVTRTFKFKKMDNSSVTDLYYRNDFFSLLSYRRIRRTYEFVCSHRGYYPLNDLDIICKDLFLTGMMLRSYKPQAGVCVLPSRLSPDELPVNVNEMIGEVMARLKRNEDPFEFSGIREYQPYDPMNRINWKASAGGTGLMVNKFNTTYDRRISIFLNAECHVKWREEVFLEEGIRLAASLADRFISSHIPVALFSNGCDIISGEPVAVEAGADRGHLMNMEIALARLDASKRKDDFASMMLKCLKDDRYKGTECVIISNYRKKDLLEAYDKIKETGVNISWIIPEYGTVGPKPAGEGDGYIMKWTVGNAV